MKWYALLHNDDTPTWTVIFRGGGNAVWQIHSSWDNEEQAREVVSALTMLHATL